MRLATTRSDAAAARGAALGDSRCRSPPNGRSVASTSSRGLAERLRAASVRLLTLTGPGGVGKTRLALEAARAVEAEFADGAHFVSLAAVPATRGRPRRDRQGARDHRARRASPPSQAVERFLAAKQLLLVADNFEHVLAAAPFIGDLLERCPALTVLATSREPLDLRAEQRYPVSPLALPDAGRSRMRDPGRRRRGRAVQRARASSGPRLRLGDGNAAAVAEICRRVDGLPLAIELAAARCGLLSPAEIADRLDAALGARRGARDAPARQQTLRATIDWSHRSAHRRRAGVLRPLRGVRRRRDRQAAAADHRRDLDMLDRLVAKSLLVRRQDGDAPTRLGMLETIRAYAVERWLPPPIRKPSTSATTATSSRWPSVTEASAPSTGGGGAPCRAGRRDRQPPAVLAWAVAVTGRLALALCAALGWYWLIRIRWSEAVEWIDRALRLRDADANPALCVRVLCIKSWVYGRSGA